MSPGDVICAAEAVRRMEEAKRVCEALNIRKVTGVILDDITLAPGNYGTGTLTSLGWPDDLAIYMTHAIKNWAGKCYDEAVETVRKHGVEI